jgi:hypothetical protein
MITDPLEEWRRLKEHYGRLRGEELQSLLEESSQLTDIAKETLRAEISSRGLRVQVKDTHPPVEDDFDTAGLDLVMVKRLWDASEARRAKAFLNDLGIPCYFGPDNVESVDALPPDFEDGVDLKVYEADVARARGGLAGVLTATPGTEAAAISFVPGANLRKSSSWVWMPTRRIRRRAPRRTPASTGAATHAAIGGKTNRADAP